MRTQVLLLGIAAGCVALAAAAVFARQRDTRAGSGARRGPTPSASRGSAEPTGMVAETELALPTTPDDEPREVVDEPVPPSAADRPRANGPAATELAAEVQAALEQGLIGDERLVEVLVEAYLANGRPRRALELLQRYSSTNVELWSQVAHALGLSGDIAGERSTLLAALALVPQDEALLQNLSRIDPDLAIRHLSLQLASAPPPASPTLRATLANALINRGRAAEATALVEGLLSEDPGSEENIGLLARIDLERAIAHIERTLESAHEPAELRAVLVSLLAGAGDYSGAEAALEHLARKGQAIEANEWGWIAELWLGSNDSVRGAAALQRALALEHDDPDQWVSQLAELAPDELLAVLERRVATDESGNDEYWGSLADAYWAAGRGAEARGAWERALVLDPDDNEWPGRLQALDEGRDPYD
jgi:tetratricopeptide (TPR) repeat protein